MVFYILPGEDSVPAGVLQRTDGAAAALVDESHLVLEDLQGDSENSLQNEAECQCKNGLGRSNGDFVGAFFGGQSQIAFPFLFFCFRASFTSGESDCFQ